MILTYNQNIYMVAFLYYEHKKKASRETCFFLSNPKDWYGITRRVYGIRRKATAWHHASACILLRIDYIQHFVLIPYRRQTADFIHGFAVILRVAFLYYEYSKKQVKDLLFLLAFFLWCLTYISIYDIILF